MMVKGLFSACVVVLLGACLMLVACEDPPAPVKMVPTTLMRLGGVETATLAGDLTVDSGDAPLRPAPIVDDGPVYGTRGALEDLVMVVPPADPVARVWWFVRVPHWVSQLTTAAVGAPPRLRASGEHVAWAVARMQKTQDDFGERLRQIQSRSKVLLHAPPTELLKGPSNLASGFDAHRFLWPALQAKDVDFSQHPEVASIRTSDGSLAGVFQNLSWLLEAEAVDALVAGDVTECTRWLVRHARFAALAFVGALSIAELVEAIRIAGRSLRLLAVVAARSPAAVELGPEAIKELEQRVTKVGYWLGHVRKMLSDPGQMELWEALALDELSLLWQGEALEAFAQVGRRGDLDVSRRQELKTRLNAIILKSTIESVVMRARDIRDAVAPEPTLEVTPAEPDPEGTMGGEEAPDE